MNVQLTVVQLWALVAGGPIAMVLTVLVGILVNNGITKAQIGGLRSDLNRVEASLRSDLKRVEDSLRSEIARVEGVLSAKIDSLAIRVKAIEDEMRSPLVKN